jgi:hypothetical protein
LLPPRGMATPPSERNHSSTQALVPVRAFTPARSFS